MTKKYLPGIMTVFILLFSFLGLGQAFAATGGTSLSKWVFAEQGELAYNGDFGNPVLPGVTDQAIWTAIDGALDTAVATTTKDTWHIFVRGAGYDLAGVMTYSYDTHYFVSVDKSYKAEPKRFDGRLYFAKPDQSLVPYSYLRAYGNGSGGIGGTAWNNLSTSQGIIMPSKVVNGEFMVTIFEKMSTPYDPTNPPAYAQPGYTQPTEPPVTPPDSGGGNNGAPTRPTPPEDNWDVAGWFKYLLDWVIYVFDTFVWLMSQLGQSVGRMIEGSDNLVSFVNDFFSFLPPEIVTLIGIGIITAIILRVFKR